VLLLQEQFEKATEVSQNRHKLLSEELEDLKVKYELLSEQKPGLESPNFSLITTDKQHFSALTYSWIRRCSRSVDAGANKGRQRVRNEFVVESKIRRERREIGGDVQSTDGYAIFVRCIIEELRATTIRKGGIREELSGTYYLPQMVD